MAETTVTQAANVDARHPVQGVPVVWRVVLSTPLLIGLVITGLVLLLLSWLIPQVPLALLPETDVRSRWEAGIVLSTLFGPTLRSLGLFDLLHHPLTQIVCGGLLFCLLARAGACLLAWQQRRQPAITPVGADRALRLAQPAESTGQALSDYLQAEGYTLSRPGTDMLIAQRNPRGIVAGLIGHLAGAMVAGSVLFNAAFAWGAAPRPLAIGDIGSSPRAGLRWRLAELTPDRAILAVAPLNAATDTAERRVIVPRSPLLPGWPLDLRDTGRGLALRVQGRSAEGAPLVLQASTPGIPPAEQVTLLFDQPNVEQLVAVPATSLVLRIVAFTSLPNQGINGPVYQVQAFVNEQVDPVLTTQVQEASDIQVGDNRIHLDPQAYANIAVSSLPGWLPGWLATLVALGSLALALLNSPQRVWAAWAGGAQTAIALHADEPALWRRRRAAQALMEIENRLQPPTPTDDDPATGRGPFEEKTP